MESPVWVVTEHGAEPYGQAGVVMTAKWKGKSESAEDTR